jgi:hypothetical protein
MVIDQESADQAVELSPEEKVGLLLELLSISLIGLADEQGDVDLETLKGLSLEFLEDGGMKLDLDLDFGDAVSYVSDASVVEEALMEIMGDSDPVVEEE